MILINRKLCFRVDAVLARMCKDGELTAPEYTGLHMELLDAFRSDELEIEFTEQLEAIYNETAEKNPDIDEVSSSDAPADRDILYSTIEVLEYDLRHRRIDKEQFSALNAERKTFYALASERKLIIPGYAAILPYYKRAEQMLVRHLDQLHGIKVPEPESPKSEPVTAKDEGDTLAKTEDVLPTAAKAKEGDTLTEKKGTPPSKEQPVTVTEADILADETKISPETGIGYDGSKSRWKFRRKFNGVQKTIGSAKSHAEIVALKREWEKQQ